MYNLKLINSVGHPLNVAKRDRTIKSCLNLFDVDEHLKLINPVSQAKVAQYKVVV